MRRRLIAVVGLLCLSAQALSADVQPLLRQIRQVQANGSGNLEAQAAVQELSQADATVLPQILEAFEGANPLAENWLRGAFETIAARTLAEGQELPADEMEAFIRDTSHSAKARRLAYEWLIQVDPGLEDELIPGMLRDPSSEFRRDAVQRLIDQAEQIDTATAAGRRQAQELYEQALTGATDADQVQAIVEPLEALGVEVDLPRHFGFLTEWHAVGPFDNTNEEGFAVSHPPENDLDLSATYPGKEGEVSWQRISTDDDYGKLDLAKSIGPYKGAIVYLTTTIDAPEARAVQFRLGTPNAWKLWLNGELLFAREEYHRGSSLDQYRVSGRLKAGENRLLLMVCQNEQDQDWAQDWSVQFRVTDASGAGLNFESKDAAAASNQ